MAIVHPPSPTADPSTLYFSSRRSSLFPSHHHFTIYFKMRSSILSLAAVVVCVAAAPTKEMDEIAVMKRNIVRRPSFLSREVPS